MGVKRWVHAGLLAASMAVAATALAAPDPTPVDALLDQAGVACLSGTAFGAFGDGYIRFSYANSLENILDAVERIRKVSGQWAK